MATPLTYDDLTQVYQALRKANDTITRQHETIKRLSKKLVKVSIKNIDLEERLAAHSCTMKEKGQP